MGHSKAAKAEKGMSTKRASVVFAVAALVTLAGGVALERLSESISTRLSLCGVLFAAMLLPAATALPRGLHRLAVAQAGRLPARRLGHLWRQRVPARALPAGDACVRHRDAGPERALRVTLWLTV